MSNRTRAETITAGATQLTNYTYNIANQLISDGAQSFSYDANGRLISAGDRSYSYALNDRLIALSQPGLSATFAYNGDGVRLAQTENGSQTRYLVDTQRSYSEVVGAITPESETWYLLGLDVLGQQQGSDWSYYAYDGLGSVRLALDSSGSPSAGMRYEPYGQPAASWGTPPALGFTGEWTDSSGLLYLRARYLDPSSATFLSRDPFEGLPTRVLSRNGYSWVEGNPINYVDPSGEFAIAAVPFGLKALAGFLTAAGAGLLTSGLMTQATQYFMGMLVLQVCLPQLTNLFNSLDHGLDQTFGPRPQPIPGWAGGGGIAVPVPGQGTIARPASQSDTQGNAIAIATAVSVGVARATEESQRDWEIVYRNPNASQHPDALAIGFYAKNPAATRTVRDHVRLGSRIETQYISLTRSLEVAIAKNEGLPIYAIDLAEVRDKTGVVIDLTVPSILDQYISDRITRNYATASQEVLVQGWIPPHAIKFLIDLSMP